jgi:hypothetical protein
MIKIFKKIMAKGGGRHYRITSVLSSDGVYLGMKTD